MTHSLTLSTAARRAFDRLAADCRRVFGDRFESAVAYDPRRSVVFARSVTPPDMDALAPLVEVWHRDGLATPLVMTRDEFTRSIDAFPLEYQAIADRHTLIAGADPFGNLTIDPEDLRRACEVQAKAHLIHLRQGWLEAAGHDDELAEVIEASAEPWRILLVNVARLQGHTLSDDGGLAAFASSITGMPPDLVGEFLKAEHEGDTLGRRLVPRLAEYVAGAERLWATIDAWRSA